MLRTEESMYLTQSLVNVFDTVTSERISNCRALIRNFNTTNLVF